VMMKLKNFGKKHAYFVNKLLHFLTSADISVLSEPNWTTIVLEAQFMLSQNESF
jgi:hypothetical protein